MKSTTILPFLMGGLLFMASSCATVPNEPLASGELRLLKINILQREDLKEKLPFPVSIDFEADGTPQIRTACFIWSGQGPYCSKVSDISYGSPGIIRVQILPRRTGPGFLETYVIYMRDGKTETTNVVNTNVRIVRQK